MKLLISIIIILLLLAITWIIISKQKKIPKPTPPLPSNISLPTDLPIVDNIEKVKNHNNQMVYVKGIYQQIDVRMKQENPTKLYKGHICIQLEDKRSVIIEAPAKPVAIRPKKEINELENQWVLAKGRILPFIPQKGNNLRMPCLIDVETIELLK